MQNNTLRQKHFENKHLKRKHFRNFNLCCTIFHTKNSYFDSWGNEGFPEKAQQSEFFSASYSEVACSKSSH